MEYSRGAEAVIEKNSSTAKKTRNAKTYRAKELDVLLRKERTRHEVKLMQKAALLGINVPKIKTVSKFSFSMEFIRGKKPTPSKNLAREMGKILYRLHDANIIHGDFTPANLIQTSKELYVIDFGLGFVSKRIEDKADDAFTALRSLKGFEDEFLNTYLGGKDSGKILDRVNEIKHRARYMG